MSVQLYTKVKTSFCVTMNLKKHIFVFLISNLTIYSVISEDTVSLIEETLKNVETKINHINKTSSQMLPNHPDGEFEILKMFQDILPDIEKVAGHLNLGLKVQLRTF